MKKPFITFLALCMLFLALPATENHVEASSQGAEEVDEKVVEVYYFHRNRRCGPCRRIENFTKKTMETFFQEEMETGTVVFHIMNVQQDENQEVAKKFNAVSTALHINTINGQEEESTNLTRFAYRNVRNEEGFLTGLKDHVTSALND